MATRKELEELGKKFIDAEIEVLNKTNTSIYENGIYNKAFESIEEWQEGIKEFLMFDRYVKNKNNLQIRYFYESLAELVNKSYIRYKEILGDVDRLNLKTYLQVAEILDQEQKIYDLERYNSSMEVIEAQEHLNNIVLSSYSNQLRMIQDVISSEKLKHSIEVVVKGKDKKEIKEAFSEQQLDNFEYLYNLTKKGNENKLEAEIKKAQESIEEAKERQKNYDEQKNKQVKLEELKKDKNAITNFFSNKQAVESTIKVLNSCCEYYYSLIFINEFITCLTVLDIQKQFYFMNPLELMSYSKLQGGLEDLMGVLEHKNIRNLEFNNTVYKFISLELFGKGDSYTTYSKNMKEIKREYEKILYNLRCKITEALEMKNRKNLVKNIVELEKNFIESLLEEKGWQCD